MKSTKRLLINLCVIVAIIIVAGLLFGSITFAIDAQRIEKGEAPLFAVQTNGLLDGGTVIYSGFGYHIVKWHGYAENYDYSSENGTYACGWEMSIGNDVSSTISLGPRSGKTIDFHFE